jgi:hypothetical protein
VASLKKQYCVIDESGSFRPTHSDDFILAGIIFDKKELPKLHDLHKDLQSILGIGCKKIKYRKLAMCSEARKRFVDYLGSKSNNVRIVSFYFAPDSLNKQFIRKSKVVEKLQARSEMDRLREHLYDTEPIAISLVDSIEFFVLTLAALADDSKRELEVWLDQRSDSKYVLPMFRTMLESHSWLRTHKGKVTFGGTVSPELRDAAAIADIVANDVKTYFRYNEILFSNINPNLVGEIQHSIKMELNGMVGSVQAGEYMAFESKEPLVKGSPFSESREIPMIGGYWKNIANRLMCYATSDGVMCQLKIKHGHDWFVTQYAE